MGTMTIRLPDDKHARLKQLAQSRGISVNKLIEEFSTQAIAESDAYTRFQIAAARGDKTHGLKTLDTQSALNRTSRISTEIWTNYSRLTRQSNRSTRTVVNLKSTDQQDCP